MSHDHSRRSSTIPFSGPESIPHAPPLPAPRPLQRARDAATRLFGYSSRPPSPQEDGNLGPRARARFASLTATQNATASHKTGLEINTIAINEEGTHALLGGKDIFKSIKVQDGVCAEELNLRSAIRRAPTQASGKARQIYSIDIADVAWAKGDCGQYVAAATSSGKIILYDLGHAGIPAAQLHEHFRQVHKVTFNPHRGSLLLSGSQDGTVRLWDVRDVRQASTLRSKHKYSGQSDGVRDVKWSPTEGVDFAFGTDSGWVQRWDIRNLKTAKVKIPAHSTTCNTIDWHPDGKHLVSASSDQTVRVWDFSVNRKQKASWEIKTPYPVLNARWRPPCESSMPSDQGARQCTQLVTAYDHKQPIIHIWDFRRPALPFREMSPYSSAPSDLLWHSQDLLWTVGTEGTFLQADIQHAQKIIDKRNLQAFAVSPHNDINFVTQKRQNRRQTRQRQHSAQYPSFGYNSEQNGFSRSWTDDSLDHSFLSAHPPKRNDHSKSKTRTQSLSMATSSEQLQIQVAAIHFSEILLNRKSFRPTQLACRGVFAGGRDAEVFAFLARNCKIDSKPSSDGKDLLQAFEDLMDYNARCIDFAGLYRLAQSWRIVAFITTGHLKERAEFRLRQMTDQKPRINAPLASGKLSQLSGRSLIGHHKSPVPAPASTRPVSAIARQLAPSDSASSHPTPLARPQSPRKTAGQFIRDDLPDLEKDVQLNLPPLIVPRISQPTTSAEQQTQDSGRLTSSNLCGLQRLHQDTNGLDRVDMVRKWSIQPKEPLSLDPVDSNGVKIPPKLEKRDSEESFAFLEGSLDSRGPSFPSSFVSNGSGPVNMVAERPSRIVDGERTESGGIAGVDFGNRVPEPSFLSPTKLGDLRVGLDQSSPPEPGIDTSLKVDVCAKNAMDELDVQNLVPGSYPDEWGIHPSVERKHEHVPLQRTTDSPVSLLSPPRVAGRSNPRETTTDRLPTEDVGSNDVERQTSPYLPRDDDDDLEESKPFTVVEMLKEIVTYHAGKGDAQTAAHLLLLIVPLLPRTHALPHDQLVAIASTSFNCFVAAGFPEDEIELLLDQNINGIVNSGINPFQNEAILSTYHDQLMHRRLFDEAASLRKLCYPNYPAVYDLTLKDNSIHLKCGGCGKPLGASAGPLRCESCRTKQSVCPVCWCERSPMDIDAQLSTLLSTCLLCNHSGHSSCMRAWFEDSGEGDGGCPTAGCLCDCVAGVWRTEKARIAEKRRRLRGHTRVKSDDWTTQESRAVERTRKVLGVGADNGGRSGFSA